MPTSARAGVKYFHARVNGEMLFIIPFPRPIQRITVVP